MFVVSMFMIVLVVVRTECCQWKPARCPDTDVSHDDNHDVRHHLFYIDIKNEERQESQAKITEVEDNYKYNMFKIGDTLQLTCEQTGLASNIYWTDNKGFKSDVVRVDSITLCIKPDRDDDGLRLSCNVESNDANEGRRSINIQLANEEADTSLNHAPETRVKLKRGQRWSTRNKCYGMSASEEGNNVATPQHTYIESFNEAQNGTAFTCVWYEDEDHTTHNNDLAKVLKYERIKEKYIFELEEEEMQTTSEDEEKTSIVQTSNATSDNVSVGENASKSVSDVWSNSALVAGAAAAIIISLVACTTLAVYLARAGSRRRARRNNATSSQAAEAYVVYAEIDTRSSRQRQRSQPDARLDPPYAVIVGTLMPAPTSTSATSTHTPTTHTPTDKSQNNELYSNVNC